MNLNVVNREEIVYPERSVVQVVARVSTLLSKEIEIKSCWKDKDTLLLNYN